MDCGVEDPFFWDINLHGCAQLRTGFVGGGVVCVCFWGLVNRLIYTLSLQYLSLLGMRTYDNHSFLTHTYPLDILNLDSGPLALRRGIYFILPIYLV